VLPPLHPPPSALHPSSANPAASFVGQPRSGSLKSRRRIPWFLPSSNRAAEASFHPIQKSSSRDFLRRPAPQRLPLMALANLPSGWRARRTFHRWPAHDATSQSETVLEAYRRDLAEFGTGLCRETEVLREAVAWAVRDLPSSAHALDGLADIVAQGKEALSINPSSRTARRPLPPPPPGPTSGTRRTTKSEDKEALSQAAAAGGGPQASDGGDSDPNCNFTLALQVLPPMAPASNCGVILPAKLIFLLRACRHWQPGDIANKIMQRASITSSPLRPDPFASSAPSSSSPPYLQTLAASPASATPLLPILLMVAPPPSRPSLAFTLATAATPPRPRPRFRRRWIQRRCRLP
jgi:hypothetical protein